MVDTFQAVAVFALAVLPGALILWGIEQASGFYGLNFADRVFRFIAYSAIFQVLIFPGTYYFWKTYIRTGYFTSGGKLTTALWEIGLLYVLVPFIVGNLIGRAADRGQSWALRLVGRRTAVPRAWDYRFTNAPTAVVRLKLKSGPYVCGIYGPDPFGNGLRSFVSPYPETQELYLASTVRCDSNTGTLVLEPSTNRPIPTGIGFLIRWDEVEYLEWVP
jgi:hypothetical protein